MTGSVNIAGVKSGGAPYAERSSTNKLNVLCGTVEVCTEIIPCFAFRNMVMFRNVVDGELFTNWWDNGSNQVAFGRGNKGFIIFNNDDWWVDINQKLLYFTLTCSEFILFSCCSFTFSLVSEKFFSHWIKWARGKKNNGSYSFDLFDLLLTRTLCSQKSSVCAPCVSCAGTRHILRTISPMLVCWLWNH